MIGNDEICKVIDEALLDGSFETRKFLFGLFELLTESDCLHFSCDETTHYFITENKKYKYVVEIGVGFTILHHDPRSWYQHYKTIMLYCQDLKEMYGDA